MLEKLGAGYPFRRAIRPKHLIELRKVDDCLSLLNGAPYRFESPIVERLYDYSGNDSKRLRNILEINFSTGLIGWHQGYLIFKGGTEQLIYPRRLQIQVSDGFRRISYSAKKKAVMAAILGSVEAAKTVGLLNSENEKVYLTRPLLHAISGRLSRCTVRRFARLLARQAHHKVPTDPMAAHLYMRAEDLQEGYTIAWDMVNTLIEQNENAGALELLSAMVKTCRIKNETAKLGLVLMKRADLEKTIGEAIRAEKTYLQIIELYRGRPSDKLLAETYKDLGDLYKMKQDYKAGIEALEKARLIYGDIGDQLELSHTLNNIGNIHTISGQMDKAYDYFRQAFRIQRRLEAKSDVASTLNNISFIFYVRGRLDRVIRIITLSLNLNREIGNAVEIARALNNRGFFYNEIGRFDRALEDLQESLEINRKIGNKKELLFNLDNLTQIMISAGRLKESFQFLREGMNLASELADMPHTGIFTGNMAVVQKRMGHYGKAIENAARAVEIGEQLDANNDHILSRINLADLYYRLNDRDCARNTIETSLKLAQERGDKRALTSIYSILALIDNDFSLIEKAETIALETKVSRDISLVRLKRSALLLHAGNNEDAFQVLSGLTTTFREDNRDIENAGFFILLGEYYLSVEDLQEARTFLEKGYRISSDSALMPEMINASIGIGKIHTMLREYEKAYAYYKKAISGFKAIADDIKDNSLRQSFLSDRKIASLADEVKKLSRFLAKK
jgi:tetratricopeptide (TPR) repeat protein